MRVTRSHLASAMAAALLGGALAGLAGATLGLAAGIISGLTSDHEKPDAREFINRLVKGDGQVLAPGQEG